MKRYVMMERRPLQLATCCAAALLLGFLSASADAADIERSGPWSVFSPVVSFGFATDDAAPRAAGGVAVGEAESLPDEAVASAERSSGDEVDVRDADAVAERVQKTYEELEDFRASFVQEFTNHTLGDTRTSSGDVFFRKPGMMRWDYHEPTRRFLISDGRRLWVYEPEFSQYYTQELEETQLPTALRFLMGDGNLQEEFEIELGEGEDEGRAVLELRPRRSEGQLRRLDFVVDTSTWQVVETIVHDPLGNTNHIRFSGTRTNSGLGESGFRFDPPEGANRVEAPE